MTLAEALYDTLFYHAAVRLQPFVELITHSATVNHGGGLRKEHERVYANPCYYANQLFSDFASAKPVKIELRAPAERAPMLLPDIRSAGGDPSFVAVGSLAARAANGDLLLSIVNRGSTSRIRLAIAVDGFSAAATARSWTLTGPVPWAANTLEHPQTVQPIESEVPVKNGSLTLELNPYSLVQVRPRSRHLTHLPW